MIARLLITLIDGYQRLGGGDRFLVECNFTPTCSSYAKQAIRRFGALAGLRLAFARIRRCRDPDGRGGIPDPVPQSLPPREGSHA